MTTFRQAIDVRADANFLFALTQDYGHRLDWDPFLKEARLLGDACQPGIGVRAWCVARSGLGMETEYVSFRPPHVAAVRMTRGPAILQSFAGSWRFTPSREGWTRVSFAYCLQARPWWLRWLLNPVLHRVFARDTQRRLQALKRAAESIAGRTPYNSPHDRACDHHVD